jgi:hypothetical protein
LETGNRALEEEVKRLRESAATSAATRESLATQLESQERSAKAAARQKGDQAEELSRRVQELEASCREAQKKAAGLEAQLREEVARSAPLFGSNLERMNAAQLEGLARLHERGLKQARTLQGQRRSEESAAATAVAAANAVTGGPAPRQVHYQRGLQMPAASPAQRPASSSLGSVDSLMSLGLDMPVNSAHRSLGPSDRAPGAAQLTSARSVERPNGSFSSSGSPAQHLQRSMTPGIASYYNQIPGRDGGGAGANTGGRGPFSQSQANAVLPNGFPNGLLSGTGLLNGQQQSGNGTHRLW